MSTSDRIERIREDAGELWERRLYPFASRDAKEVYSNGALHGAKAALTYTEADVEETAKSIHGEGYLRGSDWASISEGAREVSREAAEVALRSFGARREGEE